MDEYKAKNISAWMLIGTQFFVFIVLMLCWVGGGFESDQLTTVTGILLPTFSSYSGVAIAHFITNRHGPCKASQERSLSKHFCALLIIIPLAYAFLSSACILAKSGNILFENFGQFKTILFLLESIFGTTSSALIYSAFGKDATELPSG